MKKVVSFAVIVLCVATFVKAQDIVNLRMDRQQMALRGPVARMDESLLLRKDYFREDWPQRKWFIQDLRSVLREEDGRVVTFNPAGRMVTVSYSHQGKMGPKTACEYAANGLLTTFTGEGYKIMARYSGNSADINVFAETKDYASNIDIARENLKGAAFKYTYPFDLKCRQELTDDGLVLRSSYYYVDSVMARECEYNYDHNNMLTSEKNTDYTSGEKTVSITKYSYDNRGFLVKKVVNSKAVDATFTYENNELGDCTKMTVERPYGTVVYTFVYYYDMQNNWTVRLEYEDGVFDNATVRSFSYHKESVDKKGNAPAAKSKKTDKKSSADKKAEKKPSADKKVDKKKQSADTSKDKKSKPVTDKKKGKKQDKAASDGKEQKADKNMSKEERKAAQAAEKEKTAQEKAAAKERAALEKAAAKERKAAEKEAEKLAKEAEKERKAAEKQAEKERKSAEKAAAKESKK